MATTQSEIRSWLSGKNWYGDPVAYVIVACDTFDWEDYPVFVKPEQDFWSEWKRVCSQEMTQVMEVYDLSLPIEEQLAERRAWHLPPRPGDPPRRPIDHDFKPDQRGRCISPVPAGDNGAPYFIPCGKMRALHAEASA